MNCGEIRVRARVSRQVFRLLLAWAVLGSDSAKAEWAALSWDHCGSQVLTKQFACDSNVGQSRLVVSTLRDSVAQFTDGFRCVIEIAVASADLPSWWQIKTGGCRSGAVTQSDIPTANDLASCSYPWTGVISPSLSVDNLTLNRLRITILAGSPTGDNSMTALVESFIIALAVSHSQSVGPGSCNGCDVPACIMLRELTMVDGFPTFALVSLPVRESTFLLAWQSSRESCIATPVLNRTWGALKALFR